LTPPSKRFWIGAALLAAALAVVVLVTETFVSGRTIAPEARRRATLAALDAARQGPARRWAPDALAVAEGSLRDALVGWNVQVGRPRLFRDFEPVSSALWRAETRARDADRLAAARRGEERAVAADAVARAHELQGHAEALAAATSLSSEGRFHLQRARLLLGEADGLLREDELVSARASAERSLGELHEALGPALAQAERYASPAQLAAWRRWIDEARTWSRRSGLPAIVVLKEKNLLTLLRRGKAVRSYRAEIGANALGRKTRLGDRATPEGRYRIVGKKDHGHSRYYRALLLDYPNDVDRRRFATDRRSGRVPPGAGIGGLIEIHGEGGRGRNWTDGCVALANADMDELYDLVSIGTLVTIVGGDGRDGAFSGLLSRLNDGAGKEGP
jgi:hypothetical protein